MTEIVLIIVIMAVVFGMGKLPEVASRIGKMRAARRRAVKRSSSEVIDITPSRSVSAGQESGGGRKPGRFEESVEDARVEP